MTDRQAKLLAAIIEQYAEVAAPVGSVTMAKLFGVSSATIRTEMAKLEEMGLTKDDMRSKADYILYPNGYENPSKIIYDYQDTKRATISINYKQALEISDVIYATPCVSIFTNTDKIYPVSNFIYIKGNDFNKIEKKANELNIDIIGKISGVVGDYYSVACNRESTGNPLEVVILFHDAGILAEPIFMDAAGGSITD